MGPTWLLVDLRGVGVRGLGHPWEGGVTPFKKHLLLLSEPKRNVSKMLKFFFKIALLLK